MNPETSPENNSEKGGEKSPEREMSALEKIKALKAEQEQKRIDEENQKTQEVENDSNLRQNSYEKEKAELDQINLRKQEIEESFERIKNERTNIISSGRQAKAEAKADEAVYESLKDKEVFNEVFAGEKEQWKKLQTEVSDLGLEKTEVDNAFSEKEKKVGELFNETDEGRRLMQEKLEAEAQAKREALAEQFLPEEENLIRYFSISRLQKGEWDWNTIQNKEKIVSLPEEERAEVLGAIKEKLHGEISKAYTEKNEGNLELIKQDSDRVEEYRKNKTEISFMIRDFIQSKIPGYAKQYKELFENENNEIYQTISRYYGSSGDNLIGKLVYLTDDTINRLNVLPELHEEINKPLNTSDPVPDLDCVKDYLEGMEKANTGLIDLIKNSDAEKIKNIFSGRNSTLSWEENFDVNGYRLNSNLRNKIKPVKNDVSSALRLKPEELKGYYNQKISEQNSEMDNLNNFTDASIDETMIQAEAMAQNTTIRNIESDLNISEKNKKSADFAIESVKDAERQLKDRMFEKIYFFSPATKTEYRIPKFEQEYKDIENYSNKIGVNEVTILEKGMMLKELENKKLGIFDSKSKHENAKGALKKEIERMKSENTNYSSNRKYLMDSKNIELTRLFNDLEEVKDFDVKKIPEYKEEMTLKEFLESAEDSLEDIAETEFPVEKKVLYEKYLIAQKEREEVKAKIIANKRP